ncbi:hypothetical protein AU210_011613 [Fusarium oxysporum f. sp. radicis-cucumerinum]|uniref:Uncharacterized protein n=1 Tax=Fusarium oxysporum f. sp. radicis-cucumerinum TaxID=327505 RepID=A0A2H3GEK0_FUSOX|nr:hypothetical protein AU210_011613 [Fusarium oxysporum f. sp. radicis-cucumerinum]
MDFTWSGLKFIDALNGALRRLVISGSIFLPFKFSRGPASRALNFLSFIHREPAFSSLLDDADLTRRYSFCYHLQLPVVKNHTSPKLIIFFPSESCPSFIWLDLDA